MKLLVKIGSFLLNGFIVIIAMFSPLALCLKSQQVELSSKSGLVILYHSLVIFFSYFLIVKVIFQTL